MVDATSASPSPAPAPSPSSSRRAFRWSKEETLLLIALKRQHANGLAQLSSSSVSAPSTHKWKSISESMRSRRVDRDPVACKKRWFSLISDYKRIRDWQCLPGVEPFWPMQPEDRREKKLPSCFDKDVFKELDSWLSSRPVISPSSILDCGVDLEDLDVDSNLGQELRTGATDAIHMESGTEGTPSHKKQRRFSDDEDFVARLVEMEDDDARDRLVHILERNNEAITTALRDSCQAQIDVQREMYQAQVDAQNQMMDVQKEVVEAMHAMEKAIEELVKSLQGPTEL